VADAPETGDKPKADDGRRDTSRGVIEQTGKVVTDVVDSLKSQPAVLSLVVFNAIFLITVYMSAHEGRQATAEQTKLLLTQMDRAQELLTKCFPSSK
jgi:hypothetical protein